MSKFDRWDKSGPSGLELEQIQRNISHTMHGAIADAYRGISQSASMLPPDQQRAETPRPPSGGTVPLKPPAGVEHVDRIAESFAQRERLEAMIKQQALLRELAEDAKEPEISPDSKAAKK